jgi:hypothetical protein
MFETVIGSKSLMRTLSLTAICLCVPTMADAASFTLVDGQVIEGDIVDHSGGVAFIRKKMGGVSHISAHQIESVTIELGTGATLQGQFGNWSDDVYMIRSEGDERVILVKKTADRGYLVTQISEPETAAAPAPTEVPAAYEQEAPAPAPALQQPADNLEGGNPGRRQPVM